MEDSYSATEYGLGVESLSSSFSSFTSVTSDELGSSKDMEQVLNLDALASTESNLDGSPSTSGYASTVDIEPGVGGGGAGLIELDSSSLSILRGAPERDIPAFFTPRSSPTLPVTHKSRQPCDQGSHSLSAARDTLPVQPESRAGRILRAVECRDRQALKDICRCEGFGGNELRKTVW